MIRDRDNTYELDCDVLTGIDNKTKFCDETRAMWGASHGADFVLFCLDEERAAR